MGAKKRKIEKERKRRRYKKIEKGRDRKKDVVEGKKKK